MIKLRLLAALEFVKEIKELLTRTTKLTTTTTAGPGLKSVLRLIFLRRTWTKMCFLQGRGHRQLEISMRFYPYHHPTGWNLKFRSVMHPLPAQLTLQFHPIHQLFVPSSPRRLRLLFLFLPHLFLLQAVPIRSMHRRPISNIPS